MNTIIIKSVFAALLMLGMAVPSTAFAGDSEKDYSLRGTWVRATSVQEGDDSDFVAKLDASPSDYGLCPPAQLICDYYHAGQAELTSYCNGFDCFEMTYFEQARTVAADGEGIFPRTFMVWMADKTETPYTGWTSSPCQVEPSGNKFKIKIPEGSTICGAGLMTPGAVYYWHVASNPVTGCLGIGECKQQLIFSPTNANPTQDAATTELTNDED